MGANTLAHYNIQADTIDNVKSKIQDTSSGTIDNVKSKIHHTSSGTIDNVKSKIQDTSDTIDIASAGPSSLV